MTWFIIDGVREVQMNSLLVTMDLLLSPVVAGLTVITGAILFLTVMPLSRRYGVGRVVAAAAVVSVAGVVLLTAPLLQPALLLHLDEAWSSSRALTWPAKGLTDLRLLDLGVEGWANVALFVPVGFFWSTMTGRRWTVLLACSAGSYLAETLQAGLLVRVADPRDLYANVLGALAGVAAAVLVARWRDRRHGSPLLRSRAGGVAGGVAVLFVVGLGALGAHRALDAMADHEQDMLLKSLRRAYASTTSQDALSAAAEGDYVEFVHRAGVFADYLGVVGPEVVEGRFSTGSTARPRCVIVRWEGHEVASFSPKEGELCRAFREVGIPE